MEALLTTGLAIGVILLALVALARAWVHSSKAGGYRASDWSDRPTPGPRPPEDDAQWRWGDGQPRP